MNRPLKRTSLSIYLSIYLSGLAVVAGSASSVAYADDEVENLSEIQVVAQEETKPAVEKKTHHKIQQELIRDTKDLVRYSTDVGVADNGRHLKGFAMRGVEGNRVGISIDGVNIPDFEENSLYKRYGNFNNSRLSVDSEFVKSIESVKGSDSFSSGSGALGGTVNYKTLEAQDLVTDGKFGGLVRGGYASKNSEWVRTAGIGYVGDHVDVALVYSQRNGHQMKSAGGNITPQKKRSYDTPEVVNQRAQIGMSRIEPDPSTHLFKSYLAKLTWKITPAHRWGVSVTGQRNRRFTNEYSYNDPTAADSWYRDDDDIQKLLNLNTFFEWKMENPILSLARVDVDYQKTENGTINYKGYYKRYGGYLNGYYSTEHDTLERVDFRNMKTEYKRLTFRLDGQPFTLLGDHLLSFKAFTSKRDFENINNDLYTSSNRAYIYTIQRPTATRQYGFSLEDSAYWNDIFSSVLGIRWDQTKVTPEEFNAMCSISCRDAESLHPSQQIKFTNWSGKFNLEGKINDTWKAGYGIGSGFRVPTSSELYFQYNSPAGAWKANPNLKSERSINHNVFLQGEHAVGSFYLNLYYSKYRNFLFEQETIGEFYHANCQPPYLGYICRAKTKMPSQQMVNLDRARIYGLELKTSLNLNEVSPLPEGLKTSFALGYSKGKLSNDDSLLSIQPLKLIFGLDYEAPSGKWGVFTRTTYQRGKKGSDAKITEKGIDTSYICHGFVYYGQCYGTEERVDTEITNHMEHRWLNKSYWVFDMFGYYNPTKNITLRAGVYNLFDVKYHTWDTLRGINTRGTTDKVDYEHNNQGLERFYAPGRNYSVSMEYRF